MASQYIQIRSKTGFSTAIEHLESLIEALKRGTICINQRGRSIRLKPSEPVGIELEAEVKPNDGICREKIVLALKWEIRESWLREGEVLSIVPQSSVAQTSGCFAMPYLFDQSDDDDGRDRERDEMRVSRGAVFQEEATAEVQNRMVSQYLKVKAKAGLVELINHLEYIDRSLKEGHLCIRKNGEAITLEPQDPVMLELRAEAKLEKDSLREKLVIELKWKHGEQASPDRDVFTITHLEPPEP